MYQELLHLENIEKEKIDGKYDEKQGIIILHPLCFENSASYLFIEHNYTYKLIYTIDLMNHL